MGFKRSGRKFGISDRRRVVLDVDNHSDRDGGGPEELVAAYVGSSNSAHFSFGDGTSDSPFSVSFWFNIPSLNSVEGYRFVGGKLDFNGVAGQPALPKTGSTTRANEWFVTLSTGQTTPPTNYLGLFLYDIDQPDVEFPDGTIFNGGGNSGSQLRKFKDVTNDIEVNRWYHFCATYTGQPDFGPAPTTADDSRNLVSSGMEVYIDGVNIGGTAERTGFYNNMSNRAAPFTIGAGADAANVGPGTTNNFPHFGKGSLNDFSLYNKSLSATEVLYLYESGRGFDLSSSTLQPNMLSWFPLGNGDSLVADGVKDVSGGFDGSPEGLHALDGLNLRVERV